MLSTTHGLAHQRIIAALEAHGSRSNGRGDFTCPGHEDRKPSLSVSNGRKGVVLHCHAGCELTDILSALGLREADLFDSPGDDGKPRSRVAKRYDYADENGKLLFQVERLDPKGFRQRRPDGAGGWAYKLKDVRRVPYRLPELLAAVAAGDPVYIVEGEKDADRLHEEGWPATCNPSGVGKWRQEYSKFLRGAEVTIIQDKDEAGQRHAREVRDSLQGIAKSVRIVEAATGKDASDHLAAGHSVDELVEPPPNLGLERRIHKPGYSGPRLLALLDRPRPAPIHAGIPVPGHFNAIFGASFSGKSSLVYWNGMARAAGVIPWSGVTERPPERVLLLSSDEGIEQAVRRMNGLATFHPAGALEKYADRITVVGPDRDVDPESLEWLCFDEKGLAALRELLEDEARSGEPFTEVYLDAYADFLPPGASENSSEEGTRIGGALERIAVQTGAAITMLHHTGHRAAAYEGDDPIEVRLLARGTTALAAKARVVTALESMRGMPHLRRLRVQTNLGPAPKPLLLQVAEEGSGGDELLYFRAFDLLGAHKPEDYLIPGKPASTRQLARALAGIGHDDKKEPPGETRRLAAQLREHWLEQKLIRVVDGPRNAKNMILPENEK